MKTKVIEVHRRFMATVMNPLGAMTYVSPSMEAKQIGNLRKRQSVRILRVDGDFGLVSEVPERWCLLSDISEIEHNKPIPQQRKESNKFIE